MNVESRIEDAPKAEAPGTSELLKSSLQSLTPFLSKLDELDEAIGRIADVGDRMATKKARRVQRQLRRTEPTVTMIGQVKAGKTSLVNAMVGWPDLLPADVNPWTSVITSLHLSPKPQLGGNHAKFKFFESEEWEKLLERGGRIGELAGRAGADEELEKLAQQLEEMREKSKKRLGDKFEMLLGQEHAYGYVDAELVERYVCLGDNFELDTDTSNQGRFADITKSADLFLHREEFPLDFCIRDTPGVNDTFMMREQITIRAIRESRICVVVLSAHQALSTVDLALIRLIANIPSREVLIFVNRIDELSDPASQVPEIRESIRETLRDHQGPADAQILFGSAYWANNAIRGAMSEMSDASRTALASWAPGRLPEGVDDIESAEAVWHLSGVTQLYAALAERVDAGMGGEAIDRAARAAANLVSQLTTAEHIVSGTGEPPADPLDRAEVPKVLDAIEANALEALDRRLGDTIHEFFTRLDRSHKSFLDRATGSLIKHLEANGEKEVWHYDATGLRVLLRTAFQVFSREAQGQSQKVYLAAAGDIREIYVRAFGVPNDTFRLEAPPAPYVPSPVLLGQTIALDLNRSWWSRWWHKRRGYRNFAVDFAEIIKAETDPIVEALKQDHAQTVVTDAKAALAEFLGHQRETLVELVGQADAKGDEIAHLGASPETRAKIAALETTRDVLARYVEGPVEEAAA